MRNRLCWRILSSVYTGQSGGMAHILCGWCILGLILWMPYLVECHQKYAQQTWIMLWVFKLFLFVCTPLFSSKLFLDCVTSEFFELIFKGYYFLDLILDNLWSSFNYSFINFAWLSWPQQHLFFHIILQNHLTVSPLPVNGTFVCLNHFFYFSLIGGYIHP